jgi:hypothetical protein
MKRDYCITPFHLEYFIKSVYVQLVHFKWDFIKTLHAYILPYADMLIVTAICYGFFLGVTLYYPFWVGIFHQQVCMHNSS